MLQGHELSGVLNTVAQAAADLGGARSGHISLITPDGKNLKLAASTGPLSKLVGRALPREGSMAGWAIEQGKPLVINDLTAGRSSPSRTPSSSRAPSLPVEGPVRLGLPRPE